ncbi:complex I subunit 1/NuoH family protein [Thermosphaera sp.]
MVSIIDLLIQTLIYPGLVFTILLIIFTQWLARKLSARIQFRRGPVYAGPAGILQPLADLLKLVAKKDMVNKYSLIHSPVLAVSLGIGVLIVAQLALPVAYIPIYARYDAIAVLYFLLIAPFAIAYLAVAHPNPYTTIGAARFLAVLAVSEPVFAASLLVPLIISSRTSGEFSIYLTSLNAAGVWTAGFSESIAMILAFVSGFIGMLGVLMAKPFDTAEAESEIYWGVFTELGGPRLALGFFLKFAERIVIPMVFAALFLGGVWPADPSNWVISALVVYLKTIMVFTVLVVVDSILPRYKPEQAVRFMLKYAYPLAVAAILLSLA